MNFITYFLPFNSFDLVVVVVNQLTNMVNCIHCTKTLIDKIKIKIFLVHVFQNINVPKDIIKNIVDLNLLPSFERTYIYIYIYHQFLLTRYLRCFKRFFEWWAIKKLS
jgi:hypothetical protein